jgi:hypothetical protein
MRITLSQVAVVLLLVLISGVRLGHAQGRTASVTVTGVVVDPTGAVLPNAQVDLRNGAGETLQSVSADGSGSFRFPAVSAGRYELRVTFEGFEPTTVHLTVGNRAPAPVRVTMPLAGVRQEVTVGNAPSEVKIDAASNLDSTIVDQKALENLPMFNQDIVGTVSRFLDASAIGTNGATLIVNGVEVNNLNVSPSAIQEIKINQDPYAAEFMRPGRGRIEIVTKPGSLDYHGTLNVFFRDSAVDARNAFAATHPHEQRRQFEGFLGGPVRQSRKTSFTLSAKVDADDTQAIVFADTPSGTIHENVSAPYRNILASGGVTHQRSEKTTMSLMLSYQDQTTHNQGVGGVTLPSAATNWNFVEQGAIYTQQTVISSTLLHQVRLFVGQEFEPTASVRNDPKIVVLEAFVGGGAQGSQLRTEHHFNLTDALIWSHGRQTIKAGINIPDWSRRRLDDNTNTGGTFYFSTLADYAAGRPYSFIQQVGNGHVAFLEKVVGVFVQDEVRLRPNLSMVLGLRYDWQNYFHDDDNIAPRASIAFAPTADGRTVIRGGAGVFYDRSGPRPIQELIRYDGVRQRRYVITNPGYPNPLQPGETFDAEPTSIVQLAPDINIPATLQYGVSVERQLRKSTTVSISYNGSRGFDQFRSRDINAPAPPLFAERPDPTRAVVRQIESAGKSVGNAVTFTVRGQLAPFFTGSAQYTLSETKNDTSGITWMPPNAYDLSREYARADFDQRHRFDLLGTINPGSWFNLGIALALYSGKPYSITTGRDDFNTGSANARPAGVPRNSLDGPGYADVDLRWSRDLFLNHSKKEKGPALTLGVDAFNLLNRVNASAYVGTLTSPFFGRAVAAQPPRRLQFSLRMKF